MGDQLTSLFELDELLPAIIWLFLLSLSNGNWGMVTKVGTGIKLESLSPKGDHLWGIHDDFINSSLNQKANKIKCL